MRRLPIILCLLLVAPGHAGELDGYLTGELTELVELAAPVSLAAHEITWPDGSVRPLGEKRGKVLLVNLWARWCVPCKDEMADFARLQADLGDDRFEVVALPMKKRSLRSARKILKSWGAENLEPYGNDPETLARSLYDAGLFTERTVSFVYPTTYVVDREGRILAVREGFLHWDTPEARRMIQALKERGASPRD